MKIILCLSLLFSSLVFSKDDDGGWTSSGGGLGKSHAHNPWLFQDYKQRDPAKTWCIEHGGNENFSLKKELAKNKIQRTLELISESISSYWPRSGFIEVSDYKNTIQTAFVNNREESSLRHSFDLMQLFLQLELGYGKENQFNKLATRFQYKELCDEEVDLKFLLGVIKGPEYEWLEKNHFAVKNRNAVALTINTDYKFVENKYEENEKYALLQGKGFIWLAPDLGEKAYLGEKNVLDHLFDDQDSKVHQRIWDRDENMDRSARGWRSSVSADKSAVGPFIPVILHELGHVYGYRHTSDQAFEDNIEVEVHDHFIESDDLEIMGENFVYNVVKKGFVLKRTIKNSLTYFGNSEFKDPYLVSWYEYLSLEVKKNLEKHRIAYKLPFLSIDPKYGASYNFPNAVWNYDFEFLMNILKDVYAIEIEYGLGNFGQWQYGVEETIFIEEEIKHNYPAKIRFLKLNKSPSPNFIMDEDDNEKLKLSMLEEFKALNFYVSAQEKSTVPFIHSKTSDLGKFRVLYNNILTFVVELRGKPYSITFDNKNITFFNLRDFSQFSIKLKDKIYHLYGEEVDKQAQKEQLPDPFHLEFLNDL